MPASRNFPGEKCAVPSKLVNLPFIFLATVGEQFVVVLDEVAVFDVPEFFGDGRGIAKVDKHEHQVFFNGVLVLAENRIDKDPRTEFFMNGTDKGNQVPEYEKHDNEHLVLASLECRHHML